MWDKKRGLIRPSDQGHAIRIPDRMILVMVPTFDLAPFRLSACLHVLHSAGAISEQLCVLTFASESLCKVQRFLIPLGEKSQLCRGGLSVDILFWWTSVGSYILDNAPHVIQLWLEEEEEDVVHLPCFNNLSFRKPVFNSPQQLHIQGQRSRMVGDEGMTLGSRCYSFFRDVGKSMKWMEWVH